MWARSARAAAVVQYQIWRIVFIHRGEVGLMKSGIMTFPSSRGDSILRIRRHRSRVIESEFAPFLLNAAYPNLIQYFLLIFNIPKNGGKLLTFQNYRKPKAIFQHFQNGEGFQDFQNGRKPESAFQHSPKMLENSNIFKMIASQKQNLQ